MKLLITIFFLLCTLSFKAQNSVSLSNIRNDAERQREENNRKIMQSMGYKLPPTQAEIQTDLENKKNGYVQKTKQQEQLEHLKTLLKENVSPHQYFDNQATYEIRASQFENAYSAIIKMLVGEEKLDITKAIYLVENAYLSESLSLLEYYQQIESLKSLVRKTVTSKKLDVNNPNTIQWAIREVFRNELKYDFEDFWGDENWKNQFVSKALETKKGQCHSLPLLYLILAKEFKIDAWLSFSPEHSFIKFPDPNGKLLNFETTNGFLTSNSFIMGSGFIHSEAILSKSYLDTLSDKQTIAYCLLDLAQGYKEAIGFNDGKFIFKCTNTCLEYFPAKNNIQAWQLKYMTIVDMLKRAMHYYKVSDIQEILHYEDVKQLYATLMFIDNKLVELGYQEMPAAAYQNWLKSVQEEKNVEINKALEKSLSNQNTTK